jgi:hypothetical protein
LNRNKWVRQIHRWLSIAFTVAVIVNIVALGQEKQVVWVGLLALLPLVLLMLTGLYLFVLPYAAKWRGARRRIGVNAMAGKMPSRQVHGCHQSDPLDSDAPSVVNVRL